MEEEYWRMAIAILVGLLLKGKDNDVLYISCGCRLRLVVIFVGCKG